MLHTDQKRPGATKCHCLRELQVQEVQVRPQNVSPLDPILKFSTAHYRSPSCSQCQVTSTHCNYQEGGKRGLPAAYMRALEERLAETETALGATLLALKDQAAQQSIGYHLPSELSHPPAPRRSKVEKLEEWKRLPLQTSEHLMAWLGAQNHQNATLTTFPTDGSRWVSEPQTHTASGAMNSRTLFDSPTLPFAEAGAAHRARSTAEDRSRSTAMVMELLETCDQPAVPNTSEFLPDYMQWRENYF